MTGWVMTTFLSMIPFVPVSCRISAGPGPPWIRAGNPLRESRGRLCGRSLHLLLLLLLQDPVSDTSGWDSILLPVSCFYISCIFRFHPASLPYFFIPPISGDESVRSHFVVNLHPSSHLMSTAATLQRSLNPCRPQANPVNNS